MVTLVAVVGTSLINGYQNQSMTEGTAAIVAFFHSVDDRMGWVTSHATSVGLIAGGWFAIGLALILRRYASGVPWRSHSWRRPACSRHGSLGRLRTRQRSDTMNRALPTPSAALFAVLGVIDIALLGVVGSGVAPQLGISLLFAFLGLVTVIGVIPARRGNRPAYLAVLITRIVSALLACGAYIAGAPYWINAIETFVIVTTVVALVLLRRRPQPSLVSSCAG